MLPDGLSGSRIFSRRARSLSGIVQNVEQLEKALQGTDGCDTTILPGCPFLRKFRAICEQVPRGFLQSHAVAVLLPAAWGNARWASSQIAREVLDSSPFQIKFRILTIIDHGDWQWLCPNHLQMMIRCDNLVEPG